MPPVDMEELLLHVFVTEIVAGLVLSKSEHPVIVPPFWPMMPPTSTWSLSKSSGVSFPTVMDIFFLTPISDILPLLSPATQPME